MGKLKKMSRKELRNIVKYWGKKAKEHETSVSAKTNTITNLRHDLDVVNGVKNKALQEADKLIQQCANKDKRIAELESDYKKQFNCNDDYVEEIQRLQKRIADLEHALDALGYESKGEFIESMTELGKAYDPAYIGQMPNTLNMGVDGQLKTEEERYTAIEQSEIAEEAEHAAWVASEVARVQQENFDNRIVTPVSQEEINKTVDNAAVEWAERNGHHFPNGRPDKDRSTSVHIKSADVISAENKEKHKKGPKPTVTCDGCDRVITFEESATIEDKAGLFCTSCQERYHVGCI